MVQRKFRVTWKDGNIEYVAEHSEVEGVDIEQVPARFKRMTGRDNVQVIRVEDLGLAR